MAGRAWNKADTAKLVKLRKQGLTVQDCTNEFPDRSYNGILHKCRELKAVRQLKEPVVQPKLVNDLTNRLRKAEEDLAHERSRKRMTFKPCRKSGKTYLRVIFTDTHGCRVDKQAFAAFVADLKLLQPEEIVCLGDHLDCDGFLSAHKPIAYTSNSPYSFAEDVDAANDMLDQIALAVPKTRLHYVEGNHEYRLRTWCLDNSQTETDRRYHERLYLPPGCLDLDKRGITYYSRGERHCGLSKRGTIKLGKCHFVHGDSHAKRASEKHLSTFGGNVVFGHTHRSEMYSTSTESTGTIAAWNPGCLCELHPTWKHSEATTWTHGYGLQFCERKTGNFQHINVMIYEGVSLMASHLTAAGFVA
jgi:predicted phosphodiesterase